MNGKTKVIPFDNSNFKIVATGATSVKVFESKINTTFGVVTVAEKSFQNIQNFDYLLLQLNFQIEKNFYPLPVSGIPGAVCARMYQYRYISLDAEFTIGRPPEGANGVGNLFDQEFSEPINRSEGQLFEIYYIPIALFEVGQDTTRRSLEIVICQDEKVNIPFFVNYYGLGTQD